MVQNPLLRALCITFILFLFANELHAAEPEIFWIERSSPKINMCELETSMTNELLSASDGLADPLSIAIDPVGLKMYWTDETGATVNRSNLDGSGREAIHTDVSNPKGIDIDIVNQKVYWVEGSGSRDMYRSNLDGTNIEIVIDTLSVGGPFQFKVNPSDNKVYWVEPSGQIRRANNDGTNEEFIVTSLVSPSGIFVDTVNAKVYWSDISTQGIFRADLDGSNQETVVTSVNANFIHVDASMSQVYWSDTANNTLYRANYFGSPQTLPASGVTNPYGIGLYYRPTPTPTPTATATPDVTPTPGPTPTPAPVVLSPDTVIEDPPEVEVTGRDVTFTFIEITGIDEGFVKKVSTKAKKQKKVKLTARYELEIKGSKPRDKRRITSKKNSTTVKNLKPGAYSASYRATVYRKRTANEQAKAKANGKTGFDSKYKKVGSTNFSPSASFTV